jgi:hypothetical protein
MVAKKGTALNKSAEIRKALAQFPDKGPAEIARMLTQQLPLAARLKAELHKAVSANGAWRVAKWLGRQR